MFSVRDVRVIGIVATTGNVSKVANIYAVLVPFPNDITGSLVEASSCSARIIRMRWPLAHLSHSLAHLSHCSDGLASNLGSDLAVWNFVCSPHSSHFP